MKQSFYLEPYSNAIAAFPELEAQILEEATVCARVRAAINEDEARDKFPLEHNTNRGWAFRLARLIGNAQFAQDVAAQNRWRREAKEWSRIGFDLIQPDLDELRKTQFDEVVCSQFKAASKAVMQSWEGV